MEISFTVYGEPVPKERPRHGNGYTYTPEKTKIHEAKIALVYKSIYHDFRFEKGVPLKMHVDFYMGIPKSDGKKKREKKLSGEIKPTKVPDADNLQKLVQDAANKVVFYDDSQVVEISARKLYSDKPRTEIKITEIGGGNGD